MARKPTRTKAPAKKPVDAPAPVDSRTVDAKIDVSPRFKLVFNGVMTLTVGCFVIAVALTWREPTTPMTEKVISSCLTMATMGFGAICGLLGGKNL